MEKLHNRYQNAALELSLSTSFELISEYIKSNAEIMASKNLPKPYDDRMKLYFEEFHLMYQPLLDKINAELQFKTTCHEVIEHEKSSESEVDNCLSNLANAKEKHIKLDSQFKNTPAPGRLGYYIAFLIMVILPSFEGILAISVFEAAGFNLIESILAGLFFAIVLATLAHSFFRLVMLGKTALHQRIIAISLILLLLTIFIWMAVQRADYLTTIVNSDPGAVNIYFSPIPFIGISILLFIVALAVCHFYFPTKKQFEALKAFNKLKQEKLDKEAEIINLEKTIKKIRKEHSELKTTNGSILVYASIMEELIINNAKSGYALWKRHNLVHRADKLKPTCFDDTYPFEYSTNFHSVRSLS